MFISSITLGSVEGLMIRVSTIEGSRSGATANFFFEMVDVSRGPLKLGVIFSGVTKSGLRGLCILSF